MTLTVLIADDQPLMRGALRTCLEAEPDITVVGEAGDGAETVRMTQRLRPGGRRDGRADADHGRHRGHPADPGPAGGRRRGCW